MKCPVAIVEVVGAILQLGFLRIRAFGWQGDAARCAIEADHVHNLPNLLSNYSDDALRFYWEVERPAFLKQSDAEAARAFEPLWQRLELVECLQSVEMPSV